MRIAPSGKTFITLWTVATSIGVGVGWALFAETGNALLVGVSLAVTQALVLLPERLVALYWFLATVAGWATAVVLLGGLNGTSGGGSRFAWVTIHGVEVTGAIGFLPFVGIPVLTLVQWVVLSYSFKKESLILWFGASVCSFPVAGFVALVLADPRGKTFLNQIPSAAPMFWLIGGIYGFFTGWAIAVGAPDIYRKWQVRDKNAIIAVCLAALGFLIILTTNGVNLYLGRAWLEEGQLTPVWVRAFAYLALGYALGRYKGFRLVMVVGLVILLTDLALEGIIRLVTVPQEYGYYWEYVGDVWHDWLSNMAVSTIVSILCVAAGAVLSRWRLFRSSARPVVYRVKL